VFLQIGLAGVLVGTGQTAVWADQVQMQNGDMYYGRVVSLNDQTLVLRSDVLGTIRVPRGRVAGIIFRSEVTQGLALPKAGTNSLVLPPKSAGTNSVQDLSGALRQLSVDSNLVQQVQTQFLADAGPEAKDKFNQLMGGLMSGKLNLTDIRAEAKTAADQVRSLRKDLGEEAGSMIDGYLAILDSFLKETAASSVPATSNTPPVAVHPKAALPEEE